MTVEGNCVLWGMRVKIPEDYREQLRHMVGYPEQTVTDNGPQFVSEEFATFMQSCMVSSLLRAHHIILLLMDLQYTLCNL